MTTTMLPEAPAPQPPSGDAPRYPAVFANLLPGEIIAGRHARQTTRKVLAALVALVVLLAGWYAFALLQTSGAKGNLAKAQRDAVSLQNKVKSYGPLVTAQSRSAAISRSLTRIMADDLQWAALIRNLLSTGPKGIVLDKVSGTIIDGTGATASTAKSTGGQDVLNQSGKEQVGTVTITGLAPDKDAVAAYADQLATVTGFAAPFPATVEAQGTGSTVSFTINVIITTEALGGRYSTSQTAQGGH